MGSSFFKRDGSLLAHVPVRLSRRTETGEGRRSGYEVKMKKSLMPCERRDLSSVTPDEPASDDEERGMPDLRLHSQFAEKGIAHNRHADCADRSTDVRSSFENSSFPDCRQAEESPTDSMPRMKFVMGSPYLTFPHVI